MYLSQSNKEVFRKIIKQFWIVLGFGLLSILLGFLRFDIPGLTGTVSDLREVAILASLVYLPNIISVIGVSFITSFSAIPKDLFFSTFLMHSFGTIVIWFLLRIFRKKFTNVLQVIVFWFGMVLLYYLLLIFPLALLIRYFDNRLNFISVELYFSVINSAKFEIITTTLIVSLFMAFKHANEGEAEKLEWLDFVIKEANLGFWSWNLKAKKIHYHKYWFRRMKFKGESDVDQEFVYQHFHPDDVPQINNTIRRALQSTEHKIASYEHRFYDGENSLKWFLTKGKIVAIDKEGKPSEVMGLHIDITPLKLAYEDKLLSERRYREIFHAAKDIIFLLAPDSFLIIDANISLSEVLGYQLSEVEHKKFYELSVSDGTYFSEALRIKLENAILQLPLNFEWKLKTKTEEGIWVEVSLNFSESLEKKYILAIVRNKQTEKINQLELENYRLHLEELVEQKSGEVLRLNEELLEKNEELNSGNEKLQILNKQINKQKRELEKTLDELRNTQMQLIQSEKLASIGTLVAGVAHEINNPLNFISGGLSAFQQIKDEVQKYLSEESLEMLSFSENAINEGLQRATKIVESLMSISSSKGSFKQMVAIGDFVEKNVFFFKTQLPESVVLIFETRSALSLPIYADKMHQAILNILDNALFELKNAKDDQKDLIVTVFEKKIAEINYLVISIYNTGNLIPPENLNKVFEAFFTTKAPNQGKGLGLTISYAIVKEHNGFIRIENRQKGVEVCIYLPINYFT